MPDFDKNLQPIIKKDEIPSFDVKVQAPKKVAPMQFSSPDGGGVSDLSQPVDVFSELQNASNAANYRPKGMFVTNATLEANKRYRTFNPTIENMEDFAGYGQSGLEQAANGILKGANLIGTTVAGGFGMLYGAGKSIATGKLSDIWNNEVLHGLDKWNNKVDNELLANYYTDAEKNAAWYSYKNWFTPNFVFDKLVKNSGFAIGAMVSGNIVNAGLLRAGALIGEAASASAIAAESSQAFKLFTPLLRNTARAFSAAKNVEAYDVLRKEITSIADLTAKSSKLGQIASTTNRLAGFNDAARRTIVAAYSSAGEAAFEGIQTATQYKQVLIEKFKKENGGQEPLGEDLKAIESDAERLGNVSFLGNLALLGVTEYVQLPYLMGSSYNASRQVKNSLLGQVDNVILKDGKYVAAEISPSTRFGKLYQTAKGVSKYVFDPKEAGQEIGQYTLQVGAQNYFKKGYEGKEADVWVDGFLYGLTGTDERGTDVGALVSKEGIESGILGGITGGLMQAQRTYKENKATAANTSEFLTQLNSTPYFKQAFQDRLASTNRGVVLQQQHEAAIMQDDKLEAKDIEADMMHNYLSTRIKYGRFDMVMDDIKELKQQALTEEGLAALKEQGVANINDTVESYTQRLTQFENVAKNTEQLYKAINLRYSGEILTDEDGKAILTTEGQQLRKYSPEVIDKMVYASSKIADYDLRIPQVNSSLATAGINTFGALQGIIENGKPNKKATQEALAQINKLDVTSDIKDELKTDLSDVIELSMRRKLFIEEYDDIKKNPLNYTFVGGYGSDEKVDTTPAVVKQTEEVEGQKKPEIKEVELEINKEYPLKESLRKEGTELQLAPKITVLSKTLGGEFEVRLPNGKVKFLTPEEFKNYNISDTENASEELTDTLSKAIDDVLNREEYADVDRLTLVPMPNKVDYINSLDNQQLVDDIETEFNKQAEELIKAKEAEAKRQQQLLKNAEQVNKEQKDIENNSGAVASVDTSEVESPAEGKLKAADTFFTSSISRSEDQPGEDAPHVTRSREFLNNANTLPNRGNMKAILVTPKQADALGLTGLVQLSYGVTADTKVEDIPDALDVENGFVAQVFVVQKGKSLFFVDKNGKELSKVGEQVDLNEVVFQTMPTTKTTDSKGNPRYRADQKEEFEAAARGWKAFRAQMFSAPADAFTSFAFDVSRGIAIENKDAEGNKEKNQVGGVLVPENKIATQQDLIVIPTTGSVVHKGQILKFPNGVPVLQFGDTLQFLNNRKFNNREAKGIFQVIKALADDMVKQSEAGKTIRINRAYSTFLQNVLYWKSKADTFSDNQIRIDVENMSLKLGKESYAITDIANNQAKITAQLENAFHNVNGDTLKNKFSEPFTEYYIDKNGNFTTSEWKNYQSYLLSAKYPSGPSRTAGDTPLTTSVAKPTESVPYSFKQKYSTLLGVELPVVKVEKKVEEVKPGEPAKEKIGEYTVGEENTYELQNGPVQFTPTISSEGEVSASVVSNDTVKGIADNKQLVNDAIVPALKAADKFSATASDEQLVLDFIALRISADLQTQKDAQAPKAEAPVVSELEAKKADIEKRRQEELKGEDYRVVVSEEIFEGDDIDNEGEKIRLKIVTNKDGSRTLFIGSKGNLFGEGQGESWKGVDRIGKDNTLTNSEYINAAWKGVGENFNTEGSNSVNKNLKSVEVINAKYDAELAALEGKKPEAPKEKNANKFSGFNGPSQEYRLVGADSQERMTDAELQLFKEWHAANVPNIPFEVLSNIITTATGEKAWGVFENGVAKFVKGGLRATEYHEIFEGIYKGILSKEEQQALLDEFKAKAGTFVDRASGKKIAYDQATDIQAKERIADDFADFRKGKLPARSLGEKIRNFFKTILDFFKSFVTKPSLKEELFKSIDTGGFKDKVLKESADNEFAEYRAVAGLTEQQTHEFVQDMTARAAGILYTEGQKKLLFTPLAMTGEQMFDQIEEQYANETNADGFSKLDLLGEEAWSELKTKTKQSLRTLGVTFNEEDRADINNEEATKNDYAPEPFSTDWKKNSTGAIKFSLATLLEAQATNQEGSISLQLPAPKLSSIGGYKLLNFSRAFATVLDKLSNTSSVTKVVDKLANLAEYDPNYVRLFDRVGGNRVNKSIPFNQFKNDDWRYFIQFAQTFTKQKPDALIQYKVGNEVYIAPANLYTAIQQTKQSWIENMKAISKESNGFIKYNRETKTYQVDAEKLKSESIKTPKNMIAFLANLGITFELDVYNTLKSSQKNTFAKAVSAIYTYLGSNQNIMSVTSKTIGVNGPLSTLAELYNKVTNPNQESTYFGVENQRIGSFAENNAPSVFENEFNEANTLDELLAARPELRDVFSTNSQVLKKGGLFFDADGNRIKEVKIGYIQGTKSVDNNKGVKTTKLGLGDRFTQEINNNLEGNYYVLIPGDSSTEWMMNLGNTISFKDVEAGKALKNINSIFRGYLSDDIALALDADNRQHLKNVGSKSKELRFFKDILFDEQLEDINYMIETDSTQEQIEEYINSKENIGKINEAIEAYIKSTIAETKSILINNGQVFQYGEDQFSYSGMIDSFEKSEKLNKNEMSEKTLDDILTFANVNYIINNIEYHKVLFGDPFQFAIKQGKLDETKRVKSFLSPRRTTFDSPEYNTFLNENANKVGDIELAPEDYGYQQFKSYTNTISVKDVKLAGSLSNIISAYDNTNEADAASWLMDGTYREIKLKNGQWSDEAEAWHQWQMAYTRQNIPGYTYTNDALKARDKELVSKPAPKHTIEVLKPIVSGNKFGENKFNLVLDKFSQMPIYYSMVQGTNLEKLYDQMFKQGIGYAIVESGRKVGVDQTHSLYNSDGSFNEEVFAKSTQVEVPWKAYGIQVETASEDEKQQTRGSQLTKLSSMDLFDNGVPTSERAKEEYERNTKILNEMHQNAYNELLLSLGVEDMNNGFKLVNGKAVSETLMYEMLRREVSDNTKDAIQLDENDQFRIPFEAAPSYLQIRNILYSMVDKALIRPKMNGGAHVQVPVTGFESATKGRDLAIKTDKGWTKISKAEYAKLSDEQKKNVVLTDSTLKFYTKAQPYCEVMLPHWFKGKFKGMSDEEILAKLNTPEGKDILTGIGFRIPTQALSSIEVFRVKGFLPQYMGSTVVVPSEITTKAGSDFDIDKLNMYLKSTYVDQKGNVRLVKSLGSEEATKEFYGNVFDERINIKAIKKAELLEAFRIVAYDLADPNNLVDKYSNLLDVMLDGVEDLAAAEDKMVSDLEKLSDAGLQSDLRNKFVRDMYKKSLENEYYDSLEKLITLPENFERLISPVNDAGLEKLSEKLNKLRGYNEDQIKNRILNRNYMTTLRNTFVTAKKWVGVAAVNITNLSLKQKSKTYIDPARFIFTLPIDQKILGNGKIVLKHNTVNVNGREYVSLSGTTVKDSKELISNRLSGYATSFVDVANNPYITDIIQSDLVVGTFMFLENIGAGEQTAMFLNQPIISEYLKMLDGIGTKNLFNLGNIKAIKSTFVTTESALSSIEIDVNNLDKNIQDYYTGNQNLGEARNAEQIKIFDEFLKYAKMADYSFKFTQATNYDTSSFKNSSTFARKTWNTDNARTSNIISSVDNILGSTFIGEQKKLLGSSMQAMGAILKLEQDDLRIITDDILKPYGENPYMSADNFEKLANKVKADFLDYIIQTKTGINDRIKELLVDTNTSVAVRLEQAKKDYPNVQILRDLQVVSGDRPDGAKSVKLAANLKDAYDENLYTGMMRELRDYNTELNQLYKDLITVSILQGTYQSAISIKNIIPIEDYSKVVTPVVEAIVADENLEAFSDGMFHTNNFSDDTIMPVVQPKFFQASEGPIAEQLDSFGNYYADIYQYYSSLFPSVEAFSIKSSERKILLLSEKWNLFDVQNDFIKVPRVVTDRKTGASIDMVTGQTITKLDYAIRKAKGDYSLNDVFGYAKVKLPTGEPLTTPDKEGNLQHVYKLVNLYGDGARASEYYEDLNKQSVLENGTIRTNQIIPDANIIEYYGGKVAAKDVSLQQESKDEIKPDGLPAIEDNNENNCK